MLKLKTNRRGVALIMVLGTLLVVLTLANIILNIILSQSRLTHHQVSRIQAYYAGLAGVNYAIDKLRLGNDPEWSVTGNYTHNLTDPDFPPYIQLVEIFVDEPGSGINGTRRIVVSVDYTYTVPQ
jgi:Tfp pilus assembly protein PilX